MRRFALLIALLAASACTTDPSDRLVGTWRQVAEDEALQMRYTFFADGRARIVARPAEGAAQTYDARFTLRADSLLTLADDRGAEEFVAHVVGDTLVLGSIEGGPQTRLVRVRAAAP